MRLRCMQGCGFGAIPMCQDYEIRIQCIDVTREECYKATTSTAVPTTTVSSVVTTTTAAMSTKRRELVAFSAWISYHLKIEIQAESLYVANAPSVAPVISSVFLSLHLCRCMFLSLPSSATSNKISPPHHLSTFQGFESSAMGGFSRICSR